MSAKFFYGYSKGLTMKKRLDHIAPFLAPVPAAVISVASENLGDNIIAISWIGVAASEPPQVTIGVRRDNRFSYKHLQENGEFVVNIPSEKHVDSVAKSGTIHGEGIDKFAVCGFTRAKADVVKVPLVAECPINLECVVRHVLNLGSHDLFVGEIVAVHIDEEILTDGKIDAAKLQPLGYLPNTGKYFGIRTPEIFCH
jgi:flavin reductase (DIM6/NTAB) family NADH-FMN oxidoreductase RutF